MATAAAVTDEAAAHRFAKDHLKAFVERIERLEEEKKALSDDIRDVYSEAKANGFDVQAMDVSSADVRQVSKMAGLKDEDTSCHTAKIGNYVIEGHVPADDIKRLLKEKPAIAGLSAPGMPQGSPGMEQGSKEPYDVVAFTKDGKTTVFAKHK